MYNSFYKNLIVPDTTVVNLSILEKFQNSFSPDFIGKFNDACHLVYPLRKKCVLNNANWQGILQFFDNLFIKKYCIHPLPKNKVHLSHSNAFSPILTTLHFSSPISDITSRISALLIVIPIIT